MGQVNHCRYRNFFRSPTVRHPQSPFGPMPRHPLHSSFDVLVGRLPPEFNFHQDFRYDFRNQAP